MLACLTNDNGAAEYVDAEKQAEKTFIDYAPARLRELSSLCKVHPDPVTETSALNSILPPPITCKIKIPKSAIERGLLTDLQLESILYACDQHQRMLPCDTSKGEKPVRGKVLIGSAPAHFWGSPPVPHSALSKYLVCPWPPTARGLTPSTLQLGFLWATALVLAKGGKSLALSWKTF